MGVASELDMLGDGQLKIDRLGRCVWLRDHLVSLSPNEFDVLVYLAQHAGHVVTSDELLHEVWHYSPQMGGTKNQVRCCLKRLQRKLAVLPDGRSCIFTVRGHGWRMATDEEWWGSRANIVRRL